MLRSHFPFGRSEGAYFKEKGTEKEMPSVNRDMGLEVTYKVPCTELSKTWSCILYCINNVKDLNLTHEAKALNRSVNAILSLGQRST